MSEQIRAPKGLAGVAVTETKIAKSDVDGTLIYRGYDINDLAQNATFEETAFLVLNARLPNARELEGFNRELRSRMSVDSKTYDLIRDLPRDSHPMDVLRTAVSSLGSLDRERSPEGQQMSIAAKMPVLVANAPRVLEGRKPVEPQKEMTYAANLLKMTTEKEPSKLDAWIFERELIFYMEHDLNASSFTVRVVASTLADPYAAVTAGLAALKGPLHGGANEAAMRTLQQLKDAESGRKFVEDTIAEGKKVIGFGHRIYKKFDPRARLSKQYLKQLLDAKGQKDTLVQVCDAMEKTMWERKKIPANLDFYAAPVFYTLGVPITFYTPIFAASRVFGWVAHYNEQVQEDKLIRPDAIYVGLSGLRYVPIAQR